jgi:hypothetical protein
MGLDLEYQEGQTPLNEEEKEGLKTQWAKGFDLYLVEQANKNL